MESPIDLPHAISSDNSEKNRKRLTRGVWFLAFVALFLAPALINGFPFVMEDSIAYSGQGVNWMRPATAALLAAQLYPVLGYWSLPLISAVLCAAAWVAFLAAFDAERLLPLAFVVSILTLQPLYTSAVLVDALFFPAIVFMIVAIRRNAPALALFAAILLSSHGSGALLAGAFTPVLLLLLRSRTVLKIGVLTIVATLVCGMALHARFTPDTPQLGKTFFAARLFSVEPGLLGDECRRSNSANLCEAETELAALKVLPGNAGRRDLFWDLRNRMEGRFDLADFERLHALPIILHGLSSHPLEFAGVFATDWLSFYAPATVFDFRARLGEPMPAAYERSLQKAALMEKASVRSAATVLRCAFYLALVVALLTRWKALSPDARRWIAAILLLCLANDALFAIASGPPDRYHHRILPVAGLALLLAVNGTGWRAEGAAEQVTTRFT